VPLGEWEQRCWSSAGWFRDDLAQLFGLLSEGRIRPLVAERFPLTEARRAHELLATGSTTGKLVLTFDEAERSK